MSPVLLASYKNLIFDPLFSDVHNLIHVKFNKKNNQQLTYDYACTTDNNSNNNLCIPGSKIARPKLNSDHNLIFKDNINVDSLNDLSNFIDTLQNKDANIDNINFITNSLNDI